MVRILIGYIVTSAVFPRFVEARKWQSLLGAKFKADTVIVSDKPDNTVDGIPVIIEPDAEKVGGLFNLSKMRNRILDLAVTNRYDGLLILEADFVILRWCSFFTSRWAIPFAVYDHPSKLTFEDLGDTHWKSRNHWTDLGSRPLIPVHCVLMNRAVFEKARWDETYCGVGYDDWDFNNQLHNAVGPFEETDMLLCHRWHASSCAQPRAENKAHYESKWGKL